MSPQQLFAKLHFRSGPVAFGLLCLIVTIGALGTVGAGQATTPGTGYTIGPQDVLVITCVNDQTVSGKFVVPTDGFIGLAHIGLIKAVGLTVQDLETLLKSRYKDGGFLLNPQISVAVETYKSQHVIVQGQVRSPGTFTLTGDMTLLQLVAAAGSMTPTASGEIVIVRTSKDFETQEFLHADLSQLQNGAPDARIALKDGDVVIVQEAASAYVIGEVKNPGAYPVQRQMTLMQLLSVAGGPTADAATSRIKILRTVDGKQVEIKNAKQTELIKPGDTVVVPVRFF